MALPWVKLIIEDFDMFLTEQDMPSTIYSYQIDQITEGNDDILLMAMAAAEEEVRSYLTGNNMREWHDGRLRYDTEAIFTATGADRNPIILRHCATVAKWWLVDLCNADAIMEQVKDRYDRSIKWLRMLSKGEVTVSSLPTISEETNNRQPFGFGSREKFNHE